MFERYTEKARRTIFFARYEASQFGSPYIEAEYLLLALLREDKALANRFLRSHTAVESIRKEIEGHTARREKVSTSVDLPLSHECKRVLAYGAEESERLNHKHIGTGHGGRWRARGQVSASPEFARRKGCFRHRPCASGSSPCWVCSSRPWRCCSRPSAFTGCWIIPSSSAAAKSAFAWRSGHRPEKLSGELRSIPSRGSPPDRSPASPSALAAHAMLNHWCIGEGYRLERPLYSGARPNHRNHPGVFAAGYSSRSHRPGKSIAIRIGAVERHFESVKRWRDPASPASSRIVFTGSRNGRALTGKGIARMWPGPRWPEVLPGHHAGLATTRIALGMPTCED
jgi:hypothetical protein